MSAPCPLHPADCNPADLVHARAHRSAREALKTFHHALLYSPGSDPEARRQVWEMLERIPR